MSFLGIISKLLNNISYVDIPHVFDIYLIVSYFFLLVTKAAMNICIQIFVLSFLLTKYLGTLNYMKQKLKENLE